MSSPSACAARSPCSHYQRSLRIAERLAIADPANAEWQHGLSVIHNKIGEILRDQGDLTKALESIRAALAIRERLAKADPGNAEWQRDLGLSYGRVATVLAHQGAHSEATLAFRQGGGIFVRLQQLSPDNATLAKDIAWFEAQLAQQK
jgi:tetratricopeptide (TPR) repeat protein